MSSGFLNPGNGQNQATAVIPGSNLASNDQEMEGVSMSENNLMFNTMGANGQQQQQANIPPPQQQQPTTQDNRYSIEHPLGINIKKAG